MSDLIPLEPAHDEVLAVPFIGGEFSAFAIRDGKRELIPGARSLVIDYAGERCVFLAHVTSMPMKEFAALSIAGFQDQTTETLRLDLTRCKAAVTLAIPPGDEIALWIVRVKFKAATITVAESKGPQPQVPPVLQRAKAHAPAFPTSSFFKATEAETLAASVRELASQVGELRSLLIASQNEQRQRRQLAQLSAMQALLPVDGDIP